MTTVSSAVIAQDRRSKKIVLGIASSAALTAGVAVVAAIYITIVQGLTPPTPVSLTNAALFSNETWQSLAINTEVGVPELMGRADPFLPTGSAGNTPAGRDTLRVRDLLALSAALSAFNRLEGRYPTGSLVPLGEENAACLSDQGWVTAAACHRAQQTYLAQVPADPGTAQYLYSGSDQTYTISVRLETGKGKLSTWDFTPGALR